MGRPMFSARIATSITMAAALVAGSAGMAFAAPAPEPETGPCIAMAASSTRGTPPHLAFGEPFPGDFPFICPEPPGIAAQRA